MPKKQPTASRRARASVRGNKGKYTRYLREHREHRAVAMSARSGPSARIMVAAGGFRPDHCANCDLWLDPGNRSLFCPGCDDIAKTIRYIRKKLAEGDLTPAQVRYGLVRDEELAKVLYTKLRSASSGGYKRHVTQKERSAVVTRDGGRCVKCGAIGAEVHHIRGDDSTLTNLQLLCRDHHDRETKARSLEAIKLASRGKRDMSWSMLLRERVSTNPLVKALIAERVLPSKHLRLCDQQDEWNSLYRELRKERTQRLNALLVELCDGAVPAFAPGTSWKNKMNEARDLHATLYDEAPCDLLDCPDCGSRMYGGGEPDPDDYPSVEAWLDDPDVHAGYGPGSYFAEAMAKDD